MKYKATLQNDGTWFVATSRSNGQKMGYIFPTERAAKESAITLSIAFYQSQMVSAWEDLKVLTGGDDYGVKLVGGDGLSTLGDLIS